MRGAAPTSVATMLAWRTPPCTMASSPKVSPGPSVLTSTSSCSCLAARARALAPSESSLVSGTRTETAPAKIM